MDGGGGTSLITLIHNIAVVCEIVGNNEIYNFVTVTLQK